MAESANIAKKIIKADLYESDGPHLGNNLPSKMGYGRIPQKMATGKIRHKLEFAWSIKCIVGRNVLKAQELEW